MGENLIYVPREDSREVFSYVMDKVKRKNGNFYTITTLRKHKIHFAEDWENGDGNCREQGDDYMIFAHERRKYGKNVTDKKLRQRIIAIAWPMILND